MYKVQNPRRNSKMLANYIKHFLTFAQVLAIIHKQMKNPVDSKKEHRDGVKREETSQGWDWKHNS